MVSFTPLPLYPRRKSPQYPLDRRLGLPQSWSGCCGKEKIRYPTRTQTPTPQWSSPQPVAIPTMLSRLLQRNCTKVLINIRPPLLWHFKVNTCPNIGEINIISSYSLMVFYCVFRVIENKYRVVILRQCLKKFTVCWRNSDVAYCLLLHICCYCWY
jgi:hypothetical protein